MWETGYFPPLRLGIRQGCPLSPLLFNKVPKDSTSTIRQEKEIRGIEIGKEEIKLFLLADDMTAYIEIYKKLLKISAFTKFTGYKIHIQHQ